MMRFMFSVTVAAVGLALLAVPETRAESPSGAGSGHVSYGHMDPSRGEYRHGPGHFDYRFPNHPSQRFGYDRHGFRSLYWSNYRWSRDYRCYVYWAPSYRSWFFYEPTYSYYVPTTYFSQVYPTFTRSVPTVTPTSPVIQQTSVIVGGPSAPGGPIVPVGPGGPVGPVAGGPVADAGPGPIAPPTAPVAIQNTKAGGIVNP